MNLFHGPSFKFKIIFDIIIAHQANIALQAFGLHKETHLGVKAELCEVGKQKKIQLEFFSTTLKCSLQNNTTKV